MKLLRTVFNRRTAPLVILILLVLGVGAGVAARHACRRHHHEAFTQRRALMQDVARLGVVVMANQTKITPADARAILPTLTAVRTTRRLTETAAQELDGKLQAALSAPLRQAVSVVRLPAPGPAMHCRLRHMTWHHRNPFQRGPLAHAFNRLVDFFQDVASQA